MMKTTAQLSPTRQIIRTVRKYPTNHRSRGRYCAVHHQSATSRSISDVTCSGLEGVAYGAGELADRRTAREVEELEARPDVITRVMIG
jgi:hypothetical protein